MKDLIKTSGAPAEILAQVKKLIPGFAARAAQADRDSQYSMENMDSLRALNVPAVAVSKVMGGLGFNACQQGELLKSIAMADGSTALALAMHFVATDVVMVLPDFPKKAEILREVCEDNQMLCTIISSAQVVLDVNKDALTARRDGDEFIINGAGGFATNSEGAKYVLIFCILEGTGETLTAVVPLGHPNVRNLKNWTGMGMRSSASHDVVIDNLRVHSDWTVTTASRGATISEDNPRRITQWSHTGVWVGLARAAYEFTLDYLSQRRGIIAVGSEVDNTLRSAEPWAQMAVGKMTEALWKGETLFEDWLAKVDSGAMTDPAVIKVNRLQLTIAIRQMLKDVLMGSMEICGAHAYVNMRALERIYRDGLAGIVMKAKTDHVIHDLGSTVLAIPRPPLVDGPLP